MVKPGQSSFRRILLSRILLLSVPVLLLGEYVTYRKARSSLLETARQNLTESAIRKGESIQTSLQALQANLLTASETAILQSGSIEESQKFIVELAQRLPTKVQCIQLSDLQTAQILASTCGNQPLSTLPVDLWKKPPNKSKLEYSIVHVTTLLPNTPQAKNSQNDLAKKTNPEGQLKLVLSAPIYVGGNQVGGGNPAAVPRYVLSVQSSLGQRGSGKPRSLTGYTVVIDQDGTILEHPNADRVGRNIEQEEDAERLESIIKNAIAGQQNFLHLFAFDQEGGELLSGYTAIPSPLTPAAQQKWVILAVTRLDYALAGLQDIQQVLFTLILGLLAANLLATLYLTRDLALPIEKLEDYALNIQCRPSTDRAPHNLKIREFNQLAEALNIMVERLKTWAEELEAAWKEAKASNQLKNEFLATISHELRTPLNAIIGCIRLVRDDCCDDRTEEVEFLQRADDAAIHLLNIINDILDISKIEAGTLSVVIEPVDIRRAIKEVMDLQENPIKQKGLQLYVHESQEPVTVEADPAKLKQVLLNVVGNAIKFTDTGSITISTRTEAGSHPALQASEANGSNIPRAIISVKDTGIGIAGDQQRNLFQPFVMVDGSRTRKHGGTGLGLAISRNLIELMGGNIALLSKGAGQGTTVEISLPIMSMWSGPAKAADGKAEETGVRTIS